MFEGQLAEDFKLTTGTWVSVATVRASLLHAAPALSDAVIAGHDRAEVTALAWLNPAEVRKRWGLTDVTGDHPVLRGHLARALAALAENAGSSGRVARLLVCAEPPDLDAGEITDKGYLNQRVVLVRRAELVERLYATDLGPEVITPNA